MPRHEDDRDAAPLTDAELIFLVRKEYRMLGGPHLDELLERFAQKSDRVAELERTLVEVRDATELP